MARKTEVDLTKIVRIFLKSANFQLDNFPTDNEDDLIAPKLTITLEIPVETRFCRILRYVSEHTRVH